MLKRLDEERAKGSATIGLCKHESQRIQYTQALTANPAGLFGCHVGVHHSLTLGFPIVDGVKITTPVPNFEAGHSLCSPHFVFHPSPSVPLHLQLYFLIASSTSTHFNPHSTRLHSSGHSKAGSKQRTAMSETTVASVVPATGGAVNNDVDLKGKAVSAKLEAFARLLDPFAEGSKFTPINEPGAAEEDSNATESDNSAVAEETSGGETKDGAVAKEPDSKVVSPLCLCTSSHNEHRRGKDYLQQCRFLRATTII